MQQGISNFLPRACFIEPKVRTNRVLEQAQTFKFFQEKRLFW
jgi:hypothetical protein